MWMYCGLQITIHFLNDTSEFINMNHLLYVVINFSFVAPLRSLEMVQNFHRGRAKFWWRTTTIRPLIISRKIPAICLINSWKILNSPFAHKSENMNASSWQILSRGFFHSFAFSANVKLLFHWPASTQKRKIFHRSNDNLSEHTPSTSSCHSGDLLMHLYT